MGAQQMVGASFTTVGAEALDIASIVPMGDAGEGGSWIKWWDPTAKKYSAKVVYCYERYDADDEEIVYEGGWGDEDWFPVEKTFQPGEGFWFQAGQTGVTLSIAGQVDQPATEYVAIPLTMGAQIMVQNPFPMDLNLDDIVMDGDAGEGGSWIKWWDPTAKKYSPKAVYCYERYDADDEKIVYEGGWGDEDWIPVEKTFNAGTGFWTQAGQTGVKICFPNPFYTAE